MFIARFTDSILLLSIIILYMKSATCFLFKPRCHKFINQVGALKCMSTVTNDKLMTVSFSTYSDILKLSSHQISKLEELKEQLLFWNEKVNLISRKDIDYLVPNHILPSLAIHAFRSFSSKEKVIDVGTG